MIPQLIKSEAEKPTDVKFEDIEAVLSKNFFQKGSAEKNFEILQRLIKAVGK